jgi:stalled ribosome alternative rescue factor ArfA
MSKESARYIPKLDIEPTEMDGLVKFPAAWNRLSSFDRIEILQGWIGKMNDEYSKAHEQEYGPVDKEKEKKEIEFDNRIRAVVGHPLFNVMLEAIEQAMFGKGGRHGGNVTPFLEQPWVHYAKMHGRGFLTGQAAKKLEEAASTREGDAFKTEVLGAIVYSGMAIIKERGEA